MRFVLILLLHVALFASSYEFDEYKFIKAVSSEIKKSGKIEIDGDKTIVTYIKPKYKQIIKEDENVSIKDSEGNIYNLKGKAKYYTKLFINTMTRLGEFSELKSNKDFDVVKYEDMYNITFKGDISNQIIKAEVEIKNSKVKSFKMFMPNEDTLQIIKK